MQTCFYGLRNETKARSKVELARSRVNQFCCQLMQLLETRSCAVCRYVPTELVRSAKYTPCGPCLPSATPIPTRPDAPEGLSSFPRLLQAQSYHPSDLPRPLRKHLMHPQHRRIIIAHLRKIARLIERWLKGRVQDRLLVQLLRVQILSKTWPEIFPGQIQRRMDKIEDHEDH
jgi:hypothetical protein